MTLAPQWILEEIIIQGSDKTMEVTNHFTTKIRLLLLALLKGRLYKL